MHSNSSIGLIRKPDNTFTSDANDIAKLFSDHYAAVSLSDNGLIPDFVPAVKAAIDSTELVFGPSKIKKILGNLKEKSGGGPDDLPPIFFKKCKDILSVILSSLFQVCYNWAFLPPIWLSAIITPRYKKGDKADIKNYRPISLTCIACKVMETVIKDYMMSKFQQCGLLSKNQHAFLKKHSTTTNLLDSTRDWVSALRRFSCVDVAYIDFSRAFDSIIHSKLLAKLSAYGVSGPLHMWIAAFLRDREQYVRIENCLSPTVCVRSGVPQGSVLGPILFILYINDVTDILVDDVSCKLYADDLKLYCPIVPTLGFSESLQTSLDNLCDWSLKWQLPINVDKSFFVTISRNNICNCVHSYRILCSMLTRRFSVDDLGIAYDCNLCFDNYVNNIASSAKAKVGLLFRSFKTRDPALLKRAYVTYIRPKLEYASNLWNPFHKTTIAVLENVQRYFTRRIPSLSIFSYEERLAMLNLDTLEKRRLKSDLVLYYKILHGLSSIPASAFDTYNTCSVSRSKSSLLKTNIAGTQACYFSF